MLYAATTCEETPFPWPRTTPPDPASSARRRPRRPPRRSPTAPSSRSTAPPRVDNDLIDLCGRWPARARRARLRRRARCPDVPVLLLEGEDDLRTPVENARRVAAQFPRARLVVAPATGHSALGADASGCTSGRLRALHAGPHVQHALPARAGATSRPRLRRPRSIGEVRAAGTGSGVRSRVLTRDRADAARHRRGRRHRADPRPGEPGPRPRRRPARGQLPDRRPRRPVPAAARLRARRASSSGRIRTFVGPRRQRGRIRVSGGPGVPDGLVTIRGRRMRGTLGGRRVEARLVPLFAAEAARAAAAAPAAR